MASPWKTMLNWLLRLQLHAVSMPWEVKVVYLCNWKDSWASGAQERTKGRTGYGNEILLSVKFLSQNTQNNFKQQKRNVHIFYDMRHKWILNCCQTGSWGALFSSLKPFRGYYVFNGIETASSSSWSGWSHARRLTKGWRLLQFHRKVS